ncbi:hypothetical protein EDC94DRAFT_593395 [Helicostylum pulchrum]|nr:hypothetical protein EDC94DRAFT_593395 [Helicostylum pulchrum]
MLHLPKVLGEYDYKTGLCRILYRHLLVERTIQLQPFVWNFVLQTVDSAEFEKIDTTVTDAFKAIDSWKQFNPAEYRNSNDEQLRKAALLISAVELATFWEIPMLLQARALWYRTLSKKMPTTKFLHKIKTVSSPQCRLCKSTEDNLFHFMINCPIKQEIWSIIIPKYFPDLIIIIPDILIMLLS